MVSSSWNTEEGKMLPFQRKSFYISPDKIGSYQRMIHWEIKENELLLLQTSEDFNFLQTLEEAKTLLEMGSFKQSH